MFQGAMQLLYVSDPSASAKFYTNLLGQPPLMVSPHIAIFEAAPGLKLGLWSRSKVEPAAPDAGVSSDLCFEVPDPAALTQLHARWASQGVRIAMAPKTMYFGAVNFVALDPDGHRLRVSTQDEK